MRTCPKCGSDSISYWVVFTETRHYRKDWTTQGKLVLHKKSRNLDLDKEFDVQAQCEVCDAMWEEGPVEIATLLILQGEV